ncbi:MAG: GNAT family N-acetyltransferase [Bacteroidetes bacterium]|nr:MAG: GNAT family N-acetyltransferase [Bacteroidota bacterium]TAG88754.1 MAG: GNAT family N-acetyltransferase [Bacteroidota bacterium]
MYQFKIIEHLSQDYWKSITLRHKILREPLNLYYSGAELDTEKDSFHIGLFDENNKIIGVLILKPIHEQETEKELKMRQVAIDEDYQSKGFGKMLVDFAERLAKEKKYEIISLHSRQTAIAFYTKLDYTIESETFKEIGIPHVKMKKKL